jgi:hypothetical protein
MFDPTKEEDQDFLEQSLVNAGVLLHLCEGEFEADWKAALGGLMVCTAVVAKRLEVDLHTLLGAVMTAYRATKIEYEDDAEDGEEDEYEDTE